jgi:Flp pilus assembly pilin Flp
MAHDAATKTKLAVLKWSMIGRRGWDVLSGILSWMLSWARGRGQGMVEYALIFAVIVVVVIGSVILFGPQLSSIYKNIENTL